MPCLMDQETNMNVPQPAQTQNSTSSQQNSLSCKIREATRTRICGILRKKLHVRTDAASQEKLFLLTNGVDNMLRKLAKSEEEYSYVENLDSRVDSVLKDHIIRRNSQRRAGGTSSSVGMNVSHGIGETSIDNNLVGATFQSESLPPNNFMNGGSLINGCQPGFPISSDLQRQQTAVANNYIPRNLNHQMVDGYRPNVQQFTTHGISTPLTTTALGVRRNTVPLANRPLLQRPDHIQSNLSNYFSFGSSNRNGVVTSSGSMAVAQDTIPLNPNPMQRVNASNHSNLQQTPLPKLLDHNGFHQQACNMVHQGQRPQQLYPGNQLQKQDHSLYRTQLATTGLATSVKHEPSVGFNKEAPQQQATNGFKPSKLQYQQNPVKDHYIGAQSASVHSRQMNSSPSFQPRPQQKQSAASVVVQRQSSQQNSTQIPEKNNGERKHIGVNSCQRTPLQPARVPTSHQTVSPGSTVERKRLADGNNNTSSKQINGDIVKQRRWLLFMLHARYCTAPEDKCASKFCFRAKMLLKHTQRCKVPDCTYRLCPQTRKLILHFEECRNKSCPVCVFVKNFMEKHKPKPLRIRGAKCSSASSKCQPRESSESRQAYNKRGAEAQSGNDDLQPSIKRLKIDQHSQKATPETKSNSVSVRGVVCKSHSSMDNQKKDGLQSDTCKSVKVELKPMDINVSVAEVAPKCMNEMSAPKEESVKQSVDVVDASKMEISSLVELFTPEQVKEHLRSLRQWVGQSKTKADKNKAMERYMSVNSCQLCAVERLVYEPVPVYCSPCGARIKRNIFHYSVAAGESRYYVCTPCYNQTREDSVSIDGTSIPKARLEKKKNDEQVEEGWVQCDKCQAWQHQICALFNGRRNHGEATKYTCPNCYIKEVEQGERRLLPQNAIPGAKSLPVTSLSNHVEQRLFKKLKKERQERARLEGKSYEEVPGAESLTVRVVASVDKVLEVKQRFFELFREENYPSEFPYKSKAILLFQKIESVEVCLFGMFVQEFGTKSGPPNQRRVYISYLDSVKYFRPEVRTVSGEALRTFVYHEILIGYLDYCKKRGFTSCYIWACPPLKGEDYILNCHPEIQKMPKTDKLREWYLAMLRKASEEDVVVECTNFYDHFFIQSGECKANVTAARLPYFDGDYWPGAAEDLLPQMNQEDDGSKLNTNGLNKKVSISKRALRAVGQLDISVNASKDRLMMEKLGEIICPMKEDFIMVHLQHCCKHCRTLMVSGNRWVCNQCTNFQICDKCNEMEQKRVDKERHPIYQKDKHSLVPVAIEDVPTEIEDKDDNLESEFFDNRQAFLSLCQGNNYQYDTLRRAKHSSMMLLYHLHNPTAPAFATICTICQLEIENAQGWHCEVCPVYDVCNACYSKAPINHPHKLISRSSTRDTVVEQNGQANQRYQIQLEKIKELLVHATACRSPQCQFQGCHMMKMCFRHCIGCKIGPGGCGNCAKFWKLIRFHARCCRDSKCTVPKCRDLRAISSRQQQQSDERRRAAVMEMMRQRAAEVNRPS